MPSPDEIDGQLELARRFAARGWRPFPVEYEGKRPHVEVGKWGTATASPAPEKMLERWFTRGQVNVGIAAKGSGLVIIDEDREGAFAALAADYGFDIPDTYRVRTAKGWHYYFAADERYPIGNRPGVLADYGIDVRGGGDGDGGYVVAAGSIHESGHVYEAADPDADEMPMPWALTQLLLPRDEAPLPVTPASQPAGGSGILGGQERRFTMSQATDYVQAFAQEPLRNAKEGHRNTTLNNSAILLGHFVPAFWTADVAAKALTKTAALIGLGGDEVRQTIRSGLQKGMLEPYARVVDPASPEASAGRRLRMVKASEVVARVAHWLWQTEEFGRIPLGEVCIFAGRGNVGKSPAALWMAARLTRGDLPGRYFGKPQNVVIYASEDSLEHTIRPRLEATDADLERVTLLVGTATEEDPEMPLDWGRDIGLVRLAIEETRAVLLIIDPLVDVHKAGANTDRTQDVREGLRPIVAMAHRTGCTVIGIAHFNKSKSGDVAALLSGSHGLRDIVRAVIAFVVAPDGQRVLGQDKNNLGRSGDDVPRLTYDMASVDVLAEGEKVSQPVFTITGTTDATLGDLLTAEPADSDVDWVFDAVAAAHPAGVQVAILQEEAAQRGQKWDTVKRKAGKGGLVRPMQRPGKVAYWVYELTSDGARKATGK